MQERVSAIILSSLNKSIAVNVEAKSVHFSLLRKFPKASVQLKDAVVHSSETFNTFNGNFKDKDTLLFAESIFVKLNPLKIISGNYTVDELSIKNGIIYLFSDSTGKTNYDVSRDDSSKFNTQFELRNIRLRNMEAHYTDLKSKVSFEGNIDEGKIRTRINGSSIQFSTNSNIRIDKISIAETVFSGPIISNLTIALESNGKNVNVHQSSISLDGLALTFSGSLYGQNADLQFSAKNTRIKKLISYLPVALSEKITGYEFSGMLDFSGRLNGAYRNGSIPHLEINYNLFDGSISHRKNVPPISEISFSGKLSNGLRNNTQTSSIVLNNISLKLISTRVKGNMQVSDFTHPVTILALKGRIFPEDLRRFFDISVINNSEGSIDADLKLTTGAPALLINPDTLVYLKPVGNIMFNSFTFGWGEDDRMIKNMTGTADISDVYRTSGISLEFASQKIKLSGEFRNLPEWLAEKPLTLAANFNVSFDKFIAEEFMSKKENDASTEFPQDIIATINFRSDSLSYKSFHSSDVTGNLIYKPGRLTVNNFTMNCLTGKISGKGFITQNSDMTCTSRGDYEIKNIDIKDTFLSFRNFGQTFIKAENLSGDLSGKISLVLPFGIDFSPKISTAVAEGSFILDKGSLINFDPVKKLSDFIELSELQNIHFQRLENDFYVRDNTFYLPQMDVRSSAADIAVNGHHDFRNNYEYHVKVLLSQILSRKRREKKQPVTEFGAVQDDGLGRTSLLLKVENKGDDVKVSYDAKAVGEQVKKNINTEKQNLKTILNEEYGWYKDEVPIGTPVRKKSRVSIIWQENDSITGHNQNAPENTESVKNIFRKK
jgi:hypothetical protein